MNKKKKKFKWNKERKLFLIKFSSKGEEKKRRNFDTTALGKSFYFGSWAVELSWRYIEIYFKVIRQLNLFIYIISASFSSYFEKLR